MPAIGASPHPVPCLQSPQFRCFAPNGLPVISHLMSSLTKSENKVLLVLLLLFVSGLVGKVWLRTHPPEPLPPLPAPTDISPR